MPETLAIVAEAFAGAGTEAAVGGAVAGGAGEALGGLTLAGAADTGFGAGLGTLGAGSYGLEAGGLAEAAGGLAGGTAAGEYSLGSTFGPGGPSGAGTGDLTMAGVEGTNLASPQTGMAAPQGAGGFLGGLQTLFQGIGGVKGATGIAQLISGLYGLQQSKKLQRMTEQPNIAGEQAVQRSMAAQGYQGSGNMAAALNKYGGDWQLQMAKLGMSPLMGQLSSLGLMTSALPKLPGWGDTATAPAGS